MLQTNKIEKHKNIFMNEFLFLVFEAGGTIGNIEVIYFLFLFRRLVVYNKQTKYKKEKKKIKQLQQHPSR